MTISIFDEEYQYWRRAGLSHFEARNKAIDYWRQFTSRELTFQVELIEGQESDIAEAPDSLVEFNDMFEYLLDNIPTEKGQKLVCFLIRKEELEHLLSPSNLEVLVQLIGEDYPNNNAEIAKAVGYSVRANGSCSSFDKLKLQVRSLLVNDLEGVVCE